MSNKIFVEQKVEQLVMPIIEEHQFELVDVEYLKELGQWYLRVYIDKEGGITVLDCEAVSRALEAILDEKDPITEAYILEVSSPGLDRPLKKEKDYVRSMGKMVDIKLYQPLPIATIETSATTNKSKKSSKKQSAGSKEYQGTLVAYNEDTVSLEIGKETIVFDRKNIALIRLAVIF